MREKRTGKKLKKLFAATAIILCVSLFFALLTGQTPGTLQNPMDQEQADASRMYLTSSTLAMDQSLLDGVENANISSGGGEDSQEDAQTEEEQEQQEQETDNENQDAQQQNENNENPQEPSQQENVLASLGADSLSSLLPLIQNHQSGTGGSGDDETGGGEGGGGTGSGSGGTATPTPTPEPGTPPLDAEWFTTTIEDGATVEEKEYPFTISLTDVAKQMAVVSRTMEVNGNLSSCEYQDTLALSEGANDITITLQFTDSSGERYTRYKSYTLYYVPASHYGIFVENAENGERITGDFQVYKADLLIRVWASRGSTYLEPSVRLKGELLSPVSVDGQYYYYQLSLSPGQSQLRASAGYGQNAQQVNYVITYDPEAFFLKLESDGYSEEVTEERFGGYTPFTYTAASGEGYRFRVSCPDSGGGIRRVQVTAGGQTYSPAADASGYRTISQLSLTDATAIYVEFWDQNGTLQNYSWRITFVRNYTPADREPIINLNLTDGETLTSPQFILTVDAASYKGDPLYGGVGGDIQVYFNSLELPVSGQSGNAFQYRLALQEGANSLTVVARDSEQYTKQVDLTVYYEPQSTITVNFVMTAEVLGMGTLISESGLEVDGDTTVAELAVERMQAWGYQLSYDSTPTGDSFYLRRVAKQGAFAHAQLPEWEKDYLTEHMITYPDPFEPDPDSLGEFDYTAQSGWMVTLNDYYIGQSMGTHTLRDGDTVHVIFTLAYGGDIGVDPNAGIYG